MKISIRFDGGVLLLILIFAVTVAFGVYVYLQVRTDVVAAAVETGNDVHVLIAVADADRLQYAHVFVFNPLTRKGALFDVPGNTGQVIPSIQQMDRIDIEFRFDSAQAYIDRVEDMLGLEIPFVLLIDRRNLPAVVDVIGGFSVFVADAVERLDLDPPVLLPAGNVLLDGDKLTTFLTYEAEGERDIEKATRHFSVTRALLRGVGDSMSELSDPLLFELVADRLQTNVDRRALFALFGVFADVDVERLVTQRVLGNLRTVDTAEGPKELLFPYFEGQLLRDAVRQVKTSLAAIDQTVEPTGPISLEILNGTAETGLARRTRDLFQNFGFEVLSFGNAPTNTVEVTEIIDRRGDLAAAQRAAGIIRAQRIRTEFDESVDPTIDVTIILGRDFDGWYVR